MDTQASAHQQQVVFEVFDNGMRHIGNARKRSGAERESVAKDAARKPQPGAPARAHDVHSKQRNSHQPGLHRRCATCSDVAALHGVGPGDERTGNARRKVDGDG